MTKDWNVESVIGVCTKMYVGANDPYVTGWVNWPCKQDLYRVKFAVDRMLEDSPKFSGEDEWLQEQKTIQDKQRVWKSLSKRS
jgi:hypothetical protein